MMITYNFFWVQEIVAVSINLNASTLMSAFKSCIKAKAALEPVVL